MPTCEYCTSDAHNGVFDADFTLSTESNRLQSPLLRLPGELRNEIYSYAIDNAIMQPYGKGAVRKGTVHGAAAFSLFTCRQLRHETFEMFFERVTVNFRDYSAMYVLQGFPRWTMGKSICDKIGYIIVTFSMMHYWARNFVNFPTGPFSKQLQMPALETVRVDCEKDYDERVMEHMRKLIGSELQLIVEF